ncbi:F420-dependent methylene-tetrahydromethanopterin reductase [Streptomyces dioscori]|uniref:F420-dependent methylene-tetrahydromethanopterin reductase n=1 Tax=Streptomyces dioscori TaxID=2109333 RepID=A0A2P8PX91_9ACTN|nr:LLM class flavin-dependent oxidoreductase [Streptomyces dioscori]PSM38610.1 F420-dependent methylene-tetrahydromethanopterin reductase [Streptomyces dioscori]
MTVRTPAEQPPREPFQRLPEQVHLAAYLPGGGESTAGADFASFERLARTAERGLFDFLLLADLDAAGRPEPVTVLNALVGVTERIGLAATVDTASNEPYELARRLATLDHLSAGRAAWNVAASADPLARTAEFVEVARELWDSWTPDGVVRPFAHRGRHFDIAGEFTVPRSPQGHPVVIRPADDSPEGRAFAASTAEVLLTRYGTPAAGRALHAEVRSRLAGYGRDRTDLKIMAEATVVLGATDAEARERAAGIGAPDGRWSFVGTAESVAAGIEDSVRAGAADGFVLVPHPATDGLDAFVDRVVPLLQERGAFRAEYTGTTLRSHLGLPEPVWKG